MNDNQMIITIITPFYHDLIQSKEIQKIFAKFVHLSDLFFLKCEMSFFLNCNYSKTKKKPHKKKKKKRNTLIV